MEKDTATADEKALPTTPPPPISDAKTKKEAESDNEHEPSLMHNLNVLALAASPEIRQMEEGRIKKSGSETNSVKGSSVDGDHTHARIGSVRKQFQAALESATPESQLMLHDYEMSTCHVNSSSKQRPKPVRSVKTRNRKTKSLAVISRRFLERLPLYPSVGDPVVLSLNHLPTELGVERRRIYDILNILESVEMVRRLGRNQYQYLGYARLPTALAELRHQGHCEGLRELIEAAERERREELAEKRERRKREAEAVLAAEKKRLLAAKANAAARSSLSTAIELLASAAGKLECEESGVEEDDDDSSSSSDSSSAPSSPVPPAENSVSSTADVKPNVASSAPVASVRNLTANGSSGLIVADHNGMVTGSDDAASLGVICRRFLMLLLVSDPPVVTLNTAARVVGCQSSSACQPRPSVAGAVHGVEKENSGPSSVSGSRYNSSTVFKSKLRRLYDVTNVLATVGLVKREVDGVPVDKDEKEEKDGDSPSSASSSPSSKDTKDTKDSKEKSEKAEASEASSATGAASSSSTNAERKLRGPVFRYTGPPITSLPPVSASRLSELPSATTGGHRQGSHSKSNKCQLLVRNGSTVCLPGGANSTPSLVIVPGNSKPLRIVAPGSQIGSTAAGSGAMGTNEDGSQRPTVASLGLARARTFTPGMSQSPATVIMPSTPLLAPPRLASFSTSQQNDSASRVRPNSLLGKLLGSQNPTNTPSNNNGPIPIDSNPDSAAKRSKVPSNKRSGLSSDGTDGGAVYSAKQSRLVHSSQPGAESWSTQERIVVIAPSSSAGATGGHDNRTPVPLIVSHAQLSMQKTSQHLQKQQQHLSSSSATVIDDDEVVVVVQDQPPTGAKIIVADKSSPQSREGEFLTSVHHTSVPGVVKDVVDWLC